MPRRITAAIFSVLIAAFIGFAAPAQAATAATPSKITTLSAKAGPGAGEITLTWKQAGKDTTGFRLETALTAFSKSATSSLPRVGRHSRVFDIADDTRTFTLTAEQVADAGAAAGSGDHLYFRFAAVNKTSKGETVRWYSKLGAVQPETSAADIATLKDVTGRTDLRVASFNVRTARATDDKRNWMARRADVARQIIARHPDLVTLQEIGPGRADGSKASVGTALRQTTSLVDTLKDLGAGNYTMTRTTAYVAPGTSHGSQGTRILYNTDELRLASDCVEKTGKSNYSTTCSFDLPILDTDAAGVTRSVAYAKFIDLDTHEAFYVVSAHLDERHSKTSKTKEATYDALRGKQVETILAKMSTINDENLPVIAGGDWNSNQGLAGNAPHDVLIGAHYTDSASAPIRINMAFSTFNGFATTQKESGMGFGTRLDAILVHGGTPLSYENVTKAKDAERPSDHNMIFATLVLDKQS